MTAEQLLINNVKLLNEAHIKEPRLCFMCFSSLPSKKAFGKTNAFRVMACDKCYKEQYKGDNI